MYDERLFCNMTGLQIFIGFFIFASMIARPFLYKPCAKYFPAELSAAFTSTWLMVGLAVTFPVFGNLLLDDFGTIMTSPYLMLSLIKGILLWFMIKLQQVINKDSTSSSVFFGFVAMALGSMVNNVFFREGLLWSQLLCIYALGGLGLIFVLRGDARRLSCKGKFYFVIIILLGAAFSVFDHLAIPKIGWYPHLLFSSVAMWVACLIYGISKNDYRNIFRNKDVAIAGVVYTVSEFLIVYASINLLPVSFVAVFMRMAAPVVMIASAVKYKEQTWKNQLIFGILAFVLVLPLILIKN